MTSLAKASYLRKLAASTALARAAETDAAPGPVDDVVVDEARLSPAQRHFIRKNAELGGATSGSGAPAMPQDGPRATEYELLLMSLGQDLRQLGDIESIERKIEAKRGMIAAYLPWVAGAIEGAAGTQDEIVSTMLIWSIDTGDWVLALRLAHYVLAHGIALPERYTRKPATLIAEEFAEAGLTTPPTIDLATLQEVSGLTADHDMHDQVRAKLFKALGIALQAKADAFDPTAESAVAGGKAALIEGALTHFRTALAKNPKVGVKKTIEALEREQKKLAEAGADE